MCTKTLNSLFFDKSFVTEDLNYLPWPITLCDKEGTVLFKNRCAYRMKQFRVRSKTQKIIREAIREDYTLALERREIKLFECEMESGFCYAVTAPTPDGNIAVFWVISTFLFLSLSGIKDYDEEFMRYKDSDRLIRLYAEACQALRRDYSDAEEALVNSTLRFSRTSRHFSAYTKVMLKSSDREGKTLFSLVDMCRELTDYFSGHIASLGYRLSFTSEPMSAVALIPKNLFVSTFLQILAIMLRMAADYCVRIRLCEFDGFYHFQYSIKPSELLPLIKTATVAETEFLRAICDNSGWKFSDPRAIGPDEVMCSFSVPIQNNEPLQCSEGAMKMNEFFEIAREEAAILPRVK